MEASKIDPYSSKGKIETSLGYFGDDPLNSKKMINA